MIDSVVMLLLFNFNCWSDRICHHFTFFFTLFAWQIKMFACAYLESGHICHCTHTQCNTSRCCGMEQTLQTRGGTMNKGQKKPTKNYWWIGLEPHELICSLHLLTTVRAGALHMSLASLRLRSNVSVILHGRIIPELRRAQWKGAENRRSPIQWILKNDVSNKTMSPKVYEY